jgi:hypothetical protein
MELRVYTAIAHGGGVNRRYIRAGTMPQLFVGARLVGALKAQDLSLDNNLGCHDAALRCPYEGMFQYGWKEMP